MTGSLDGIRYVTFNDPEEDAIVWNIYVALAGRYSFRIRYMNSTGEIIPMVLNITSSDGRLLIHELVEFPDSDSRWEIMNTGSGSEMNAGTYRLKLLVSGKSYLKVDEIAVQ